MTIANDAQRPEPLLLEGHRVALGPLRGDLVPVYQRWVSSPEVALGLGYTDVVTLATAQAWHDRASVDRAAAHFTIYDRADFLPVGTCGLCRIDHCNNVASFVIRLGERRGQGLGTEATRLALDWGFHVIGLRNVELRVWAWNRAAIGAYRRAGFREAGRLRGAHVTMGRRCDVLIMDAVPKDFTGSVIQARSGLRPPGEP
jgi:RimJ/RimL family protein N-acetyltransferase